jgi:hypothetical protein
MPCSLVFAIITLTLCSPRIIKGTCLISSTSEMCSLVCKTQESKNFYRRVILGNKDHKWTHFQEDYYLKQMERLRITRTGVKSKKNADCFDYFFSVDDINEKYKDFLNPDLEDEIPEISTELKGNVTSIQAELDSNATNLKTLPVESNNSSSSNLEIILTPESEEFEAEPPKKRVDSPVPSLDAIPTPQFSLKVIDSDKGIEEKHEDQPKQD